MTRVTPPSSRRLRASIWWGLCAAFAVSAPGLSRAPLAEVPPPASAAQTQPAAASATFNLPNRPDSLKFFVLGDFGDGSKEQYELAAQMAKVQAVFPALLVITVGDNIYGREGPEPSAASSTSRTSRCSTPASNSKPRSAITTRASRHGTRRSTWVARPTTRSRRRSRT